MISASYLVQNYYFTLYLCTLKFHLQFIGREFVNKVMLIMILFIIQIFQHLYLAFTLCLFILFSKSVNSMNMMMVDLQRIIFVQEAG